MLSEIVKDGNITDENFDSNETAYWSSESCSL